MELNNNSQNQEPGIYTQRLTPDRRYWQRRERRDFRHDCQRPWSANSQRFRAQRRSAVADGSSQSEQKPDFLR